MTILLDLSYEGSFMMEQRDSVVKRTVVDGKECVVVCC